MKSSLAKKVNQSKCIIYIHDYNIPDIDDYCSELKEEYNFSDVKKITWIKTKNITSTPLLMTFKDKEPLRFIEIPGEQAKTEAYDYFERPISYKKCLKYGHTVSRCHETKVTCAS